MTATRKVTRRVIRETRTPDQISSGNEKQVRKEVARIKRIRQTWRNDPTWGCHKTSQEENDVDEILTSQRQCT